MQHEGRLSNRQNVDSALAALSMQLPSTVPASVKPSHIKRLATEILHDLASYRGSYAREYATLVAHITVELDGYRLIGFTSDVTEYEAAKAETRRLYTPTERVDTARFPDVTAKLARLRHSYDTAFGGQ